MTATHHHHSSDEEEETEETKENPMRTKGNKLFKKWLRKFGELIRTMEQGEFAFGIDQGTSNTCVAYVENNAVDNPKVVSVHGFDQTPTVFHLDETGEVSIGTAAITSEEPKNTMREVKRLIGVPYVSLSWCKVKNM